MPHKLDNLAQVFFYEQEFYVLSNFSAFAIQWNGLRFDTSEHVYHYEKFNHVKGIAGPIQQQILCAWSAHDAFKIAERNKHFRRPNWEYIRVAVMEKILRAKAEQHEYVRRKLLETGERVLIEDSWRDAFWGWGPHRNGENTLGKLWMEIRREYQRVQETTS